MGKLPILALRIVIVLALIGSLAVQILMMPLDASSVIGSLAGLAEITSEAFAKNGAGPGGRPSARTSGSVPQT